MRKILTLMLLVLLGGVNLISPAQAIMEEIDTTNLAREMNAYSSVHSPYINEDEQKRLNDSTAWHSFKARYSEDWSAIWNEGTMTPHIGRGKPIDLKQLLPAQDASSKEQLTSTEIEALIKEFVSREDVLGVKNFHDLELIELKYWKAQKVWYVAYQQFYQGMKVHGAILRFKILYDGRLLKLHSDLHPEIAANTFIGLSETEIKEYLKNKFRDEYSLEADVSAKPQLFILPRFKEGRYEYRIAYEADAFIEQPRHHYLFYVDAVNSDILYAQDTIRNYDISGNIQADIYENGHDAYFDIRLRQPVKTQNVYIDTVPVLTDDNGDYRRTVSTNNLYPVEGEMTGLHANVFMHNLEDSAWHADSVPGGARHDWAWDGNELGDGYTKNHITEANAYHHLKLFYDFVKNDMQSDTMDPYSPMPVYTDKENYDNADFKSVYNYITMGSGGDVFNNTAKFRDILYHEYMHAVTYSLGDLRGIEGSAVNEGLSDYFAANMTGNYLVANYAINNLKNICLRSVNNSYLYHFDASNSPHTYGRVFSGALWDLREKFIALYGETEGKNSLNQRIFAAIKDTSDDHSDEHKASMVTFLDNLLENDDNPAFGGDGDITNGTPHLKEIYEAFIFNHGISGLKFTVEGINGGDYDGIIEGTDGTMNLSLRVENWIDPFGFSNPNVPHHFQVQVLDPEAKITSEGFTFENIDLSEGSYGIFNPGDLKTLSYNVRPRNMYILPHDAVLEVSFSIGLNLAGGNSQLFDAPLKRKIRIPVGRKNVQLGLYQEGQFQGRRFAFQNGKMFFSTHSGRLYLYDIQSEAEHRIIAIGGQKESIVAMDGRNLLWASKDDSQSPWALYIYNLGADGNYGGGDDSGPALIGEGYSPSISGRYIAYITSVQTVALYDLGADMLKNGNDPGNINITGATFTSPQSVSVNSGRVAWSDTGGGRSNIYFYNIQAQSFRVVDGSAQYSARMFPVISPEWLVWEDHYSSGIPRIFGYHFGADGQIGTSDDIGKLMLSPESSPGKSYFKPRISGKNLLYLDEGRMRFIYMDLNTFKRMTASDVVCPWSVYVWADIDGRRIAVPRIGFNVFDNVSFEEIVYGNPGNKIADAVTPLFGPLRINGSERWSSVNRPYLLFNAAAIYGRLDIDPGVQIRTYGDMSNALSLEHGGILSINAEPSQRALITNHYDEEGGRSFLGIHSYSDTAGMSLNVQNTDVRGFQVGITIAGSDSLHNPPSASPIQAGNPPLPPLFVIKNCNIFNNQTGLSLYNIGGTVIANNTITNNARGISLATDWSEYSIRNNIISDNSEYGIRVSLHNYSGSLDYNNVWGNGVNYDAIDPGVHDISSDPLFLNGELSGFLLLGNSPSIDTGDPSDPYNNEPSPNGERINQGSYGNTALATKKPSGSSCPFVHVFTGRDYVKDNDVIPAGEGKDDGSEYKDYYFLAQQPKPQGGIIRLKLVEPLEEVSFIDRVELFAVRHSKSVKVAPDPRGKIYSFNDPQAPGKAIFNGQENVLDQIKDVGGGNILGDKNDELIIVFDNKESLKSGDRLIFRTDYQCLPTSAYMPEGLRGKSIHVSIKLKNSQWKEIDVIHPHADWDYWAVDLSKSAKKAMHPLEVKLLWTEKHKLDFIGLEEENNQKTDVRKLVLQKAIDGKDKGVKALLLESDNQRAVMKKNDEIFLEYSSGIQAREGETVSYLLMTEGYYQPLNKQ
ncbi:MAG: right-handed parallel beta-helix repeat-containing protein [Candidatus Omnitrophica bacterium]|nr:right-handed parallel beta-helix repeat-containing protein [Candidatus Omnitrophota bacterium]